MNEAINALTEENERLKIKNARLERLNQTLTLTVQDTRQQAAQECVEIMTDEYKRLGSFVAAFNTSVCAIKVHFGLEDSNVQSTWTAWSTASA